MKFRKFWNDNKPILVMVPAIIGLHYVWFYLQDYLDEPGYNKRKLTEQPIVTVAKKVYHYYFPNTATGTTTAAETNEGKTNSHTNETEK